jgi:hypothetical protein
MKVADLTVEELEAINRRTVDEALAQREEDHLPLREEFANELEARLAADEPGIPGEELAKRLGLDAYWEAELHRQDEEIAAGTARLVPFEQGLAEMLRPLPGLRADAGGG